MALTASPNGTYGSGNFASILSYTFGSSNSSYTFTSIPQTYTDLRLVIQCLSDTQTNISLQMGNGSADSGSYYYREALSGNYNGTVNAFYSGLDTSIQVSIYDNALSNYRFAGVIDIFQYTSTSYYKSLISQTGSAQNAGGSGTTIASGTYIKTVAIDTLKVINNSGNFTSGTTLSLYGRKAS